LPNNLSTIGAYALNNCLGLTSITLPADLFYEATLWSNGFPFPGSLWNEYDDNGKLKATFVRDNSSDMYWELAP
jgi:hypothetical protein